jgi:hypothetical protein
MQEHSFSPSPLLSYLLAVSTFFIAALALGSCNVVAAQTSAASAQEALTPLPDAPRPQPADPQPQPQSDEVTICNTPRNFLHDQGAIWTSPVRLRPHDLEWLAPLALATGAAIATDHRAMTEVVSRNPGFNQDSVDASNAMVYSLVATPVVLYGFGHFQQNDHAREAGIVGAESMLDGVIVEQGLKLIFWRERPNMDNARGRFFQSGAGVDSSFPSSHSLIAWSSASALAAEYPSHWAQFGLYAAAASVSLSRVMGQEHFPSDVLVGSAAGWLIGHYVVRRHHPSSLSKHIAHPKS